MSAATPDALIGNTRTIARIDAEGTIAWAALPAADSAPIFAPSRVPAAGTGAFAIAPEGPYTADRRYVGETAVLETTYQTPTGKAQVLDFLPLRPGPSPSAPKLPHDRLVRIVEGIEGAVTFRLRLAPLPDGRLPALELDPNGLIASGDRSSLVLQTEAEIHMHAHEVTGAFTLKAREKRHFVLTHVADPDPDVPEMRATEPEWELDGTFDYWLAWARACPFQGAQRQALLRLAGVLKAAWVSPAHQAGLADTVYASPYAMVAPAALAAWGWEDELGRALEAWRPEPNAARDRAQAAWLLFALAEGQSTGLVEGTLIVPHWQVLRRMGAALAERADDEGTAPEERLSAWAGLRAAHALADELMLEGAWEPWLGAVRLGAERLSGVLGAFGEAQRRALGLEAETAAGAAARKFEEGEIEADAVGACWAIRQELAAGAYLQARRMMDRLLLSYTPLAVLPGEAGPHADVGELAFVLFTAALLYLQAAPPAGRVELPGDLGD